MNIAISYRHVDSRQDVAAEVARRTDKLRKLLKTYASDAVQLKGAFAENPHTAEHTCALTLSLPTGTLHATGNGRNDLLGCKHAFAEIETQVKKHQSLLRHEHEWKRKRETKVGGSRLESLGKDQNQDDQ